MVGRKHYLAHLPSDLQLQLTSTSAEVSHRIKDQLLTSATNRTVIVPVDRCHQEQSPPRFHEHRRKSLKIDNFTEAIDQGKTSAGRHGRTKGIPSVLICGREITRKRQESPRYSARPVRTRTTFLHEFIRLRRSHASIPTLLQAAEPISALPIRDAFTPLSSVKFRRISPRSLASHFPNPYRN